MKELRQEAGTAITDIQYAPDYKKLKYLPQAECLLFRARGERAHLLTSSVLNSVIREPLLLTVFSLVNGRVLYGMEVIIY